MKVKVAQFCLTLCDPMGYTVHGVLQARIVEWVAFSFLQGIFPTQGHYFADKGPFSQNYGFSGSHVWMWELDYKESWVLKN